MRQTRLAWPPITRNIKITLAVLIVFWLGTVQFDGFARQYLFVSYEAVFERYYVWTIATYALLHGSFHHLLFNGVALWMFGGEVDQRWSHRKFWTVSLASVVGGGVVFLFSQWLFVDPRAYNAVLGYSAAVMGLVGAYCWYNWDRDLYLFFVRMTGKTLLLLVVGLDFARVFLGGANVSISAHIGGLIVGLLAATGWWRPSRLKRRIKRWNKRRKFKKHADRDPDKKRNGRWIN